MTVLDWFRVKRWFVVLYGELCEVPIMIMINDLVLWFIPDVLYLIHKRPVWMQVFIGVKQKHM